MRGRAQQRAQLRLEDFVERQAEAQAAQAERRPRALDGGVLEPSCASVTSNVRTVTRRGAIALDQPAVDGVLRLLVERRLPAPASRNSDRYSPIPSAPRSRARAASSGSSTLASIRIATPSSVTDGRSPVLVERLLVGAAPPLARFELLASTSGVGIDEHFAGRAVHGDDQGAGRNQPLALRRPATAGTCIERARIAVW